MAGSLVGTTLTLTYSGNAGDAVTIQATAPTSFTVTGNGGTSVTGITVFGPGITAIMVAGSTATNEAVTFDLNNQAVVLTGDITIPDIENVTVTDSNAPRWFQANLFSDTNATVANVAVSTATFDRPVNGGTDVVVNGMNTVNVNAVLSVASNSSIDLAADNININTSTGSISAPGAGGDVTLELTTASRAITVGTNPGTSLGLTQAELNNITAGRFLAIGNATVTPSNTGNLQVTAPITSAGTGWTRLALLTEGTITQTAGSTLTTSALFAIGDAGVTLNEAGNTVTDLNGETTNIAGSAFSFTNSTSLSVSGGGVFGPFGIATAGGAVSLYGPRRRQHVDGERQQRHRHDQWRRRSRRR